LKKSSKEEKIHQEDLTRNSQGGDVLAAKTEARKKDCSRAADPKRKHDVGKGTTPNPKN